MQCLESPPDEGRSNLSGEIGSAEPPQNNSQNIISYGTFFSSSCLHLHEEKQSFPSTEGYLLRMKACFYLNFWRMIRQGHLRDDVSFDSFLLYGTNKDTEQLCERYSSVSTDLLFLENKLLSLIRLFFLVLQLVFCLSRTNFFRVFLSVPMLLFLQNFSSSSQVTAYMTGRSKMKTKCQFSGYKSTINFSYSQPPKKRRRKKAKNATHTQQFNFQKNFLFQF
jgi:hypothetical protein